MRTLLNTFNRPAAVLSVAIALAVWLVVAIELGPAYLHSRWQTIIRVPFFSIGLYVYLVVAFNLAREKPSWLRVGALVSWLLVGVVVPYFLPYGFLMLFTLLRIALPDIGSLPLNLGTMQTAIYSASLGFVAATLYSAWLSAQAIQRNAGEHVKTDA
jgi:peptidoglycan/LPS O-acetylase OafA/YrhL